MIRSSGSTLLETAIVLPVLIVVGLGLLDISNYYRTKAAIQQASEETLRCLASLEDCASPPPSGGEPLYQVRATSGTTTTSFPLVRLGGTVTGLTPQRIAANSFDVQYLSSVTITGSGRTIFEKTYRPLINAGYLVRSRDTRVGLKGDGTYDVTGTVSNIPFRESTVSPGNRSLSLTFITPAEFPWESNTVNRCVVGSLDNFERCTSTERSNTENFFMILLEGTARNGTSGNISEVTLSLENQITGEVRRLGGQQFRNPGPGRSSSEPFLPRGGRYYRSTTPQLIPPAGSEFSSYSDLALNYNTPYRLTISLTSTSSANWELTGAKLVLPNYQKQDFKEVCPVYLSRASIEELKIPDNRLCPLEKESIERFVFLSVTGQSPIHPSLGDEGEKKKVGLLKCEDQIPDDPELTVSPLECSNLDDTVPCSGETILSGIPNYGIPENGDEQGRIMASPTAAETCNATIPEGFTTRWWNVTTAKLNASNLDHLDEVSVTRTDCLTEPEDSDLIPAPLRKFHHITVTGREISSNPESPRDFVKYQSGKALSPHYECFKPRTVSVSEYLSNDAPFGHPGEYDCATAARRKEQLLKQSNEILRFDITTSQSRNRYNPEPGVQIPQCYKPEDSVTELAGNLSETPLSIAPLPLENARAYCASHGLSCTYKLVSFSAVSTNELSTFQLAKAEKKGADLLKAVASRHGMINGKILPGVRLNASGQEEVSVSASAEVPSLLKGILPGKGTTVVRYFSARVSERGLLH
jgi:hypothetical protein